ncbi:MAG TPA: class I SAM-dependent methyltransferase [Candidatus Binataceae bacterium]|nr:class I SAM-dependent methyltransferase [Candidatus Binataceae bacterium]
MEPAVTDGFESPGAVLEAACPACGHHVAAPFFYGGNQPLATLGWPESRSQAHEMKRLPTAFVRCVGCGHVFNPGFDYAEVPYTNKPNLMFNRGVSWSKFIARTMKGILGRIPQRPTVVEIGHGEALAGARPNGRFVGFDPHGAIEAPGGVELRSELFDPAVHLEELRPDLIISRHVLEHLANPLGFLQRIAFCAGRLGREQLAYFEVPCIDRALAHGRTVDFYYEHNSQFTSQSFRTMLSRCGLRTIQVGRGYGGEVIYGYVVLGAEAKATAIADFAQTFATSAKSARVTIRRQLDELAASRACVAVWGGTGKSAAFINYYGLDARRFSIVVDSDGCKAGKFVPGMGQEIRPRDWLKSHPPDVVIIPPQWRAADIVAEMRRNRIMAPRVLIEHGGRLIDYFADEHPYCRRRVVRRQSRSTASAPAQGAHI